MKNALFKNWWILALKGALLFLLGILAFFSPEETILVLAKWLGAIILFVGVSSLAALLFFGKRFGKVWISLTLEGLVDIAIGLAILFYPAMTVFIAIVLLSFWLLMAGAFQIVYAIQIRRHSFMWWLPLLNGLVTTTLGVLIGLNPFEGSILLSYFIGSAAIFFGIMLIITSFVLKRWQNFYKNLSL